MSDGLGGNCNNKYKRKGSQTKMEQSSHLGLVYVNPIIDKKLDGVYDLDIVHMQRQSSKPLLSAIQSIVPDDTDPK